MSKLQGKTVIVTGGAGGIGGATCRRLAADGAKVAVFDMNLDAAEKVAAEIRAAGGTAAAFKCDITDRAAVDAAVAATIAQLGPIDVLVNNAARVPISPSETERRNRHYAYATTPVPRQSLGIVSSLSDDDWLKWWDVNMHGVFFCTRAALRCMEPQRSGRIVNIASIAGLGPYSMHSPGYSATKAGVISLTQTTAYDVAGANIYVNAIACGGVHTPVFEQYLQGSTEAQRNSLFQMIPSGRLGRPDEYANVALFLAADDHYLAGQVISPNGGMVIG